MIIWQIRSFAGAFWEVSHGDLVAIRILTSGFERHTQNMNIIVYPYHIIIFVSKGDAMSFHTAAKLALVNLNFSCLWLYRLTTSTLRMSVNYFHSGQFLYINHSIIWRNTWFSYDILMSLASCSFQYIRSQNCKMRELNLPCSQLIFVTYGDWAYNILLSRQMGPINNVLLSVRIKARYLTGDKPLYETIMFQFRDTYILPHR